MHKYYILYLKNSILECKKKMKLFFKISLIFDKIRIISMTFIQNVFVIANEGKCKLITTMFTLYMILNKNQ